MWGEEAFCYVEIVYVGYKGMVNTSTAARELFKSVCGKSCPGLADKSFWRWYRCIVFFDGGFWRVTQFCNECKKARIEQEEYCQDGDSFGEQKLVPSNEICEGFL
jgi:hypothetical protein